MLTQLLFVSLDQKWHWLLTPEWPISPNFLDYRVQVFRLIQLEWTPSWTSFMPNNIHSHISLTTSQVNIYRQREKIIWILTVATVLNFCLAGRDGCVNTCPKLYTTSWCIQKMQWIHERTWTLTKIPLFKGEFKIHLLNQSFNIEIVGELSSQVVYNKVNDYQQGKIRMLSVKPWGTFLIQIYISYHGTYY